MLTRILKINLKKKKVSLSLSIKRLNTIQLIKIVFVLTDTNIIMKLINNIQYKITRYFDL